MGKKTAKSSKSLTKAAKKGLVKKKLTLMDTLPSNHQEYLELLIRMTEKHIKPGTLGQDMAAQAERLKKRLANYLETGKK